MKEAIVRFLTTIMYFASHKYFTNYFVMDTQKNDLSGIKLVLFDVYETLLNMDEVVRKVNNILDSKRGYTIWFEMFMEYCFVDNCTVQFNDFSSIAKATMKMAGKNMGKDVDDHDIKGVMELLKHSPLHEDVQNGLSRLHSLNLRIAALTNSPQQIVLDRMERTGLISYFEEVLSAEHVKKYKPSLDVYDWACKKLKVQADEVLLVSSHGWDIAGGANAGMQTAYMFQDKQMLYPLAPKPNIICRNVNDLAAQLQPRNASK